MSRPLRLICSALAIAVASPLLPRDLVAQPAQRLPAGTARVREYEQSFPTYPFSDPNPIPVVGRIYPYFRFDGFSATSTPKQWKVVELENEYVRVLILPEIGGKIWAAIEKRSGRPFIYYNHAVKFRDIAMRGPWTSGGIEANYGIIGHTPNVSTPVDYTVRRNADGSVSCITGALDLLTNTTWRLETKLVPGDASFTTTSTWYNGSSLEQPYYTWMTAGIPTKDNLQYVFPGNAFIGHDGEKGDWPINKTLARDVSWYEKNDFGGYKSYHVLGGAGDFFGAYWHEQDFGMARVSPRDEKPGQKIWIWGLSRQGMIWEDLLTDTDGQYSELQSGRLFNQSAEGSTFTPFKHRGFAPQTVDRWTERWMPVVGTKGFVTASDVGALNVTQSGDRLIVAISPVNAIDDTLRVMNGSRVLRARRVRRSPLQSFADTINVAGASLASLAVTLGANRLSWRGDTSTVALDRPLETPKTFDWSSAYGFHLKGKELMRQREYDRALPLLDSALVRDPHYVPALADRAAIALRSLRYDSARAYARIALSVDTYDGASNFYYGLANRRLGRFADARDGFEIASQSLEYRAAAWTELATLWLAEGDLGKAESYARKAIALDPGTLDALGARVAVARRRGDALALRAAIGALERADPLSHLARFERLMMAGARNAGAQLRAGVRSELPEQQLFQIASWYQGIGERTLALRVLEVVGEQPEALYWRAALLGTMSREMSTPAARGPTQNAESAALIARANALSSALVFPFRAEVIEALEGAALESSDWQPRYYLALGYWGVGRAPEAARLLDALGNTPMYAPMYAARATLPGREVRAQLADLERAAALDPSSWRYGKLLTERRLAAGDAAGAVSTARAYYTKIPSSYILGLTMVRAQIAAERYSEADALLSTLAVLPYEGAAEGHALYREAKLMLAVDAMAAQRWDEAARLIAAAREWPERLGAGKPYDANRDERLEDWLSRVASARGGAQDEPSAAARAWMIDMRARAAATSVESRVLARLARGERRP